MKDIKAYSGALLRRAKQLSDMFGTLRNPYIYNRVIFRTLAYLEPEAFFKASRIFKMIMHIQSSDIVRIVYSSVFKDI